MRACAWSRFSGLYTILHVFFKKKINIKLIQEYWNRAEKSFTRWDQQCFSELQEDFFFYCFQAPCFLVITLGCLMCSERSPCKLCAFWKIFQWCLSMQPQRDWHCDNHHFEMEDCQNCEEKYLSLSTMSMENWRSWRKPPLTYPWCYATMQNEFLSIIMTTAWKNKNKKKQGYDSGQHEYRARRRTRWENRVWPLPRMGKHLPQCWGPQTELQTCISFSGECKTHAFMVY